MRKKGKTIGIAVACGMFVLAGTLVCLMKDRSSETEIFIPEMAVNAGARVKVPIAVTKLDDIAGIRLRVRYDPGAVRFLSGVSGIRSFIDVINNKKAGELLVVMAGPKGVTTGQRKIYHLAFEMNDSAKKENMPPFYITDAEMMNSKLKQVPCIVKIKDISVLPHE